jgi:hypothetical protein
MVATARHRTDAAWRRGQLAALVGGLVLAGCAGGPPQRDQLAAPAPGGFSIDLTALHGRGAEGAFDGPVAGRLVLFPDGSLHAGARAGAGAGWLPPRVRVLRYEQTEEIWALCRQVQPSPPLPPNLNLHRAAPGTTLLLGAFAADDQRWSCAELLERVDSGPQESSPLQQLARRLSALGWGADRPMPAPEIVPRRYDFGPDPYARYRQ